MRIVILLYNNSVELSIRCALDGHGIGNVIIMYST